MTSRPTADEASPPGQRPAPPAWSLSARGVRTVYRWELRRGFRAASWNVRVAVWTAVVALLVAALAGGWTPNGAAGASAVGVVVLTVLALSLTVTPVLTSGAIDGGAGLLRAPRSAWISAADATAGLVLAAWTNALLFLAAVAPFVGYAALAGGTPLLQVATSLAVVALVLLVGSAVGVGWSAVVRRPRVGAILTQATLAALAFGPLVAFTAAQPLVTSVDEIRLYTVGADPDTGVGGSCTPEGRRVTTRRVHTERIWWLLAPSPYVVLVDAAPGTATRGDVLTDLREAIRGDRQGPPDVVDRCRDNPPPSAGPVWPFGAGILLLVGAGFTVIAARRLRTVAENGSRPQ
jgi:ABC-2 type transport system permease protein